MGFLWKEEYSTGIKKIDEQHQVLFKNLNTFEKIIKQKDGRKTVEKMLRFLEQYAQKHFAFEEQAMEEYDCPAAEQNKEAHRRFFIVFEKLKQRFYEEGADELLLEQIHSFVETWLMNHILGIDIELKKAKLPRD